MPAEPIEIAPFAAGNLGALPFSYRDSEDSDLIVEGRDYGPGSFAPWKLSLAQMHHWWLRPKKIRIAVTGETPQTLPRGPFNGEFNPQRNAVDWFDGVDRSKFEFIVEPGYTITFFGAPPIKVDADFWVPARCAGPGGDTFVFPFVPDSGFKFDLFGAKMPLYGGADGDHPLTGNIVVTMAESWYR